MARTAGQKQPSEAPVDTLPKLVPTETYTSFSLQRRTPEGHSDLQSENWLFGGSSDQESLNPNSQLLKLLQIATLLLQMKLQMKCWFPAEGLQLCVNCLQTCTPQCWPFPNHLFFLSLHRSWLMLGILLELTPADKSHRNPSFCCSFSVWCIYYDDGILKCLN